MRHAFLDPVGRPPRLAGPAEVICAQLRQHPPRTVTTAKNGARRGEDRADAVGRGGEPPHSRRCQAAAYSPQKSPASTTAQQAAERLKWGPAWRDTSHVFTKETGEPWHPNRITELFHQSVEASGVRDIRVHDLRHTHATLWLMTGGHPKVLQERLGHKPIKITLDTYSHALPTMQEAITDVLDATVYGEAR